MSVSISTIISVRDQGYAYLPKQSLSAIEHTFHIASSNCVMRKPKINKLKIWLEVA